MATIDTISRATLGDLEIRPGTVVLGVITAYLLADFVTKVFFVEIWIGSVKLLGGQLTISRLATLAWDGIVIGLGIGLAGIGLSMTYSILGFANFGHGDYITAGGFAGWATTFLIAGLISGQGSVGYLLSVGFGTGPSAGQLGISALGTPLAVLFGLVIAIVATALLVLLIDRVVYRPMRDHGAISLLIASIGVALAIRYFIVFMYGGQNRGLTAGSGGQLIFGGESGRLFTEFVHTRGGDPVFHLDLPLIRAGDYTAEIVSLNAHELTLVVVAIVLMGALHLMLQRTKLGTAMRAMADNKDLARITGIPTERVIFATWLIGGGLAGAAGYLIAMDRGTLAFNLGWFLLLLIFAAVILGGIGSVYGAMVGGVVIGLTSTVSLIWIPSSFTTAAAFTIMILMLLFRPEGLFGGVTTA